MAAVCESNQPCPCSSLFTYLVRVTSSQLRSITILEPAADKRLFDALSGWRDSVIGLLRSAIEVEYFSALRLCQARGLRFITGSLPRPVWRIEMQAEQERPPGFRIVVNDLHSAAPQQIGEVACLMDWDIIIPEIFLMSSGVRIIVHSTAAESVKMIIAALERTKLRQNA